MDFTMKHSSQLSNASIDAMEFETLVAFMPGGVIALDGDQRICLCNPTAARMLGLEASTILGTELATAVPYRELQDAVQSLLPLADLMLTQQVAIDVAGEHRLLEVAIHSVDNASNTWLRHIIYLTDVTQMARSVRIKADFVANASHELRTPLSTMKAATETLLESADRLDAHQCRFLEVLSKNVERLEELARDLLELNRVESPNLQVHFESVPLGPMLEEIKCDFADKLTPDGITFTTELNAAAAMTDGKLLKLILVNLIDNCVKFVAPHNGEIVVRSSIEDGRAIIEVQDNGIGIPARDRERVFERFYQVDKARKGSGQGGTGLGLAIVKHATAAMGGSVQLESTPGTGTLVRLVLPQPQGRP